jgi:CHRD domain
MRARIVGLVFVLGLVAVGVAVAGANRNWSTHADGSLEVPARDTNAQAQAIFHLSEDGTELQYKLIASNIDNVVQAHIHAGLPGANGPIGVFLYGLVPPGGGRTDGVLAQGTITAGDLIGPFAGMSVADVAALMDSGGAYVNLHTNDGVGAVNTGPGDFPGGEIRGDIR